MNEEQSAAIRAAYDQVHLAETDVLMLKEEKLNAGDPARPSIHEAHSHLLEALDALHEALETKTSMYIVEISRVETHAMWVRAESEEQVREALTEERLPELYEGLPEWHETLYVVDRVEIDDDWREGDIDLDLVGTGEN